MTKRPKKHPVRFKLGLLEIETETLGGGVLAIAMLGLCVAMVWGVPLGLPEGLGARLSATLGR